MIAAIHFLLGIATMIQPAMVPGSRFGFAMPPTTQPENRDVKSNAVEGRRRDGTAVDEELVRRLLGGQSSVTDAVEQTLSKMEAASEGLRDRLETGEMTQRHQQDVLIGIDKLITEASKDRAASRDRSSTVRRRQSKPTGRPSAGAAKKSANEGRSPAASSRPVDDPHQAGTRQKGHGAADKADLTRGWGFLPQRDREEISQGFDEQFPAKYRERILEYYRSLAEEARRNGE